MFTSRAEYRLMLREDNADLRLTEAGRKLGLIDDVRWSAFNRKRDAIAAEQQRLRTTWVSPNSARAEYAGQVLGKPIEREYTLMDLLKRPGVTHASIAALVQSEAVDAVVAEQVEIQAKYQGYIARQLDEVARAENHESLALPSGLDYRSVRGLSIEVQQKLNDHRPETVGQASRISGITPAALSLLLVHLKRGIGAARRSVA
jgi:tRNA uridine 5-carboxymethylaminomethyl modification enzyme